MEFPITTEMMAGSTVRLGSVAIDGEDVYWLEGRPAEGGRNVLVRQGPFGSVFDVTPAPFNVRSRAHEYGGGAYLASHGRIWFVNDSDQRIYQYILGESPRPLTPEGSYRYADLAIDLTSNRLICIREDHSGDGEPRNELIAIDLADAAIHVLSSGHDFYSSPALNREGRLLAWLTWDHPNMPWDETELWVAAFREDGSLAEQQKVAGGYGNSIFQPKWSPIGGLYFIADPRGWWNPYRWDGDRAWCVAKEEAEFGLPQWRFGMRTHGFDSDGRMIAAHCEDGMWQLGLIDPSAGVLERLAVAHTEITGLAVSGRRVVFIGASPTRSSEVVELNLDSGEQKVLRSSLGFELDPGYVASPRPVEFSAASGDRSHAFYYAPANKDHRGPDGELPPLIVMSHGGPTAAATTGLNLKVQYWTSRGFAVLDVNYRGSTGYGRAYRNLLRGQWGVADVEDCVNGALHVAARGRADADRLIIRGGSAGGYCSLAALTFHDTFRAGASYYGIGDLETLARDTHKFESHYLERLVGPYPQMRELYRERSPINAVERLSCPVIFFQGLEDKVVPPNQAEAMVAALRAKRVPVAYLAFPGEQHGFRKAETIKCALEAELYFYGKVFGFTPAGNLSPVEIENL